MSIDTQQLTTTNAIDTAVNQLTTAIQTATNQATTSKTINTNNPQLLVLPHAIVYLLKAKSKARRTYQKSHSETHKHHYNQLRAQLSEQINAHKRNSWRNYCNQLKISCKPSSHFPGKKNFSSDFAVTGTPQSHSGQDFKNSFYSK